MRIIGYVLGSYMLLNALMTAVLPHDWTALTMRPFERVLPPDQVEAVEEFTDRLSPRSLRVGAAVEAVLGLLVLGLASRRSRTIRG